GSSAARIASRVDTVMFCLSKGLGAPVGSILAGTHQSIGKARQYRKRLGGGMRQAGVLAAAGLIALEEMTLRLVEDHASAVHLAAALSRIPGVLAARPQTNIVMVDVAGSGVAAPEVSARLKREGIL